jgi:hypothetical protein
VAIYYLTDFRSSRLASLCGCSGLGFDDGEGGFEEGDPVGGGTVHFVLENIGKEDKVAVLKGGLHFAELAAEFVEDGFAGEFADGEGAEGDVIEFGEAGVGVVDLLPGGEDAAELLEGGGGVALFKEGGDFFVLWGEPLDHGVEASEQGEGEFFAIGGAEGEAAVPYRARAGLIQGIPFEEEAVEFDFGDDFAFGKLGLGPIDGVGEGVGFGKVGGDGGLINLHGHRNGLRSKEGHYWGVIG